MINGNYLRLIDKIPLFIAACAGFIICLIWFSPNPEPVIEDDKWKEEHKQELENLKTEIEAEFETLKLQYEKDLLRLKGKVASKGYGGYFKNPDNALLKDMVRLGRS